MNEKKKIKLNYLNVARSHRIQTERLAIPICGEEQIIIETINENPISIICGETGCGKSTQVPQFLYEAGYGTFFQRSGMIGITQPRRIAATNLAKRVAIELNCSNTNEVAYQIRYDSQVGKNTKIKFMTDGILLREVQSDFLLTKYSVIIIDEAHERTVGTDILIGLLSRIVKFRNYLFNENKKEENIDYNITRHSQNIDYNIKKKTRHSHIQPLKLIIMSATLCVSDFTENLLLFPHPPPVINIPARQYPVTIHYNRQTPVDDYELEVFRIVRRIHRNMPVGGILVFMTGSREIEQMCYLLQKSLGDSILPKTEENNELFEIDEDEIDNITTSNNKNLTPIILPLYSILSEHLQAKVFQPVKDDSRLIVVSTNVAETSLTIPGIRYVVDTGREKQQIYDKRTGISHFSINWISQASATQRAGRAGRTGPGHCYRLYSTAVFLHKFPEFSEPEIYRLPLDSLVLQMKTMNIPEILKFPFPSSPDLLSLKYSLNNLSHIGAIDHSGKVTDLGRTLTFFPVSPPFAKMLTLVDQEDCLFYVCGIVAILSVKHLYVKGGILSQLSINKEISEQVIENEPEDIQQNSTDRNICNKFINLDSDLISSLNLLCGFLRNNQSLFFTQKYGLVSKSFLEICALQNQLFKMCLSLKLKMVSGKSHEQLFSNPNPKPPSLKQCQILRHIIASCLIDNFARKWPKDLLYQNSRVSRNAYQCGACQEPVFIHPHSVLFSKHIHPEYLIYSEIQKVSKTKGGTKKVKLYLHNVTSICPQWVLNSAPSFLIRYSDPLERPPPFYNSKNNSITCYCIPFFKDWELPVIRKEYSLEHPIVKKLAKKYDSIRNHLFDNEKNIK